MAVSEGFREGREALKLTYLLDHILNLRIILNDIGAVTCCGILDSLLEIHWQSGCFERVLSWRS